LGDEIPASQQWYHWRGPNVNGTADSAARPPVTWDREQNVKWIADLPGEGSSTPVVHGNQIFVLSARQTDRKSETSIVRDEKSRTVPPDVYYQFIVSCLNRSTGEKIWEQIATEQVPHEGHHPTHTYCAGSPTTDGTRLYASFGSRGIYCYSLDGELLWQRDPGDMRTRYGWGEAVTPAVHGNSLVVNWDQEEGSYITCLDTETGEARWKTERPNEVTSWNTPLITTLNDRTYVVANGTHRVRAYDLATGEEVWSCGGQTVNAIPSVLRYQDFVVAMSGYRGAAAIAIPLNSTGDITESGSTVWAYHKGTPYVPSAVLSGHRLFFTGGNADILTVLDVRNGQPIGSAQRLSGLGQVYASPIAANGHLYFMGRDGTCVVLQDDDSLQVVAVNRLNDAIDASPIAIEDQLLLRSWTKLYCVSGQQ
jgi:outer membrane protein assembly factor BamB